MGSNDPQTVSAVEFGTRESQGHLDTAVGAELRSLEDRVRKGEATAIEARWLFGHVLLRRRQGGKLPAGMLDAVVAEHGISRTEIHYRVQFADRYPDRDALLNALSNEPSWRQLCKSLSKSARNQAQAPSKPQAQPAFTFRRWRTQLDNVANDLDDSDLRELTELRDAIDQLIAQARQHKAVGS